MSLCLIRANAMNIDTIPEYIDGLPNICGSEDLIAEATRQTGLFYLPESGIDFDHINSAFAIALHMHQPLIPAGGENLRTALPCYRAVIFPQHPDHRLTV